MFVFKTVLNINLEEVPHTLFAFFVRITGMKSIPDNSLDFTKPSVFAL